MRRRLRARWKRRAIGTPSSTSPAARHAAFRAQCRGVHRRATDAPSVPAFSALVRRQRCSRSGSFRPLRRTYLTRMRRTRQAVGLMSPSCPAPREQETVMRSRRCSHLARRMRPGGTATQSLRPTPPSSRPRPKAPAQRSWKSFLPTVTRLPRVQTTSWTPLSRLPSMSWPRSAANTTPCSPISTGTPAPTRATCFGMPTAESLCGSASPTSSKATLRPANAVVRSASSSSKCSPS
mmetsp:Transcript_82682/g.246582  ORF Transcript_82682/g.246582 Transcript_82682/m.246582 type:complete len:236 (+) Transcript_82682:331-1038(+)